MRDWMFWGTYWVVLVLWVSTGREEWYGVAIGLVLGSIFRDLITLSDLRRFE